MGVSQGNCSCQTIQYLNPETLAILASNLRAAVPHNYFNMQAKIGLGCRCTSYVQPFSAAPRGKFSKRTVCCSRVSADQDAFILAAEQRQKLQQDIKRCVQQEKYEQAATLKRQLEELEDSDTLLVLQRKLTAAVAEERYKEAAALKAELDELQKQTGRWLDTEFEGGLSTTSVFVTHGIRVRVQSYYLPVHSQPSQGHYFFAYNVTISNESDKVVQLNKRHWIITDGQGKREEVRGPGVIGQQPVLLPGKSFSYDSGCPLPTSTGAMEGSYSFFVLDEEDGRFKDMMDVRIARFKLDANGTVGA